MSPKKESFSLEAKHTFEKKFNQLNKIVLESVADVVGVADSNGDTIYISPSVQNLCGYNPSELLTRNGMEFVHPDDMPSVLSGLKKLPKTKEVRFEYRFKKKDGTYLWLDNVIRLVTPSKDKTEYMVFVAREIEQRKQLEYQILHTAKELAQLNVIKDKLISLIAHDLKNPIYNIISLTEFVKKKLPETSYEELIEFISRISESANSSYVLLENLLEWAKVQSGDIEFKPEQVKIRRVIMDNWNLMKVQANFKNQNFKCDVPESLSLNADFHMFDTIIRNLLSNAVKFTPEKGSVIVDTETTGSEIIIRFKDTGIGMSREQQRYLFQADSRKQLNGITTGHGSGLGLVLCNDLVLRHKGKIAVESKIGMGTTITLHFPVVGTN